MSDSKNSLPSSSSPAILWLRRGMEGIVLFMAMLSPWAYGAVDPAFEYALYLGIGLLAVLWGVHAILQRKLLWFSCPITLCLALIFTIGVVQLVPIPSWLLAIVSPAAYELNGDLRPSHPEIVAAGEPPATSSWRAMVTVYPEATRQELYRWLAVLVLFAAVRNVVATSGSLRRLSWAAAINGIFLSVFAIYQFFATMPHHREVFGYSTAGEAFGPFICRNNFPDYINFCIGLSVSLLLISSKTEGEKRAIRTHKAQALVEQNQQDEAGFSILSILHSPLQLWLSVGVSIMVGAVICSMSRGGVASLVAGVLAAMILRGLGEQRRGTRLEVLAAPVILAAGFVAWLGINPLESRLALWQKGILSDARISIWKNLLPLTYRFPILGSGYGTLQYVEPLNRQFEYPGYQGTLFIDHAHNDYLEALIEGGVGRLILTVAMVYFVLQFGRTAMRRHGIRTPGRLAMGAIIGVAALAVHSIVDFGSTTPAVACMAAVVAGHLASMARSDPSDIPNESSPNVIAIGARGWGGAAAAIGLAVVALVLATRGSSMNLVQVRHLNAYQAMHQTSPPNFKQAETQLREAVSNAPLDARLREELGQLYFDWGRHRGLREANARRLALAAAVVGTISDQSIGGGGLIFGSAKILGGSSPFQQELYEQNFAPGLRHMIAARDLCPLLVKPQHRLASYAADSVLTEGPRMAQSDPAKDYWRRALRLAPFDPDLLYFVGLAELKNGRPENTWPLWRKSLERHPRHAREIVRDTLPRLGADQMMAQVLVSNPAILLETAQGLTDNPTAQRTVLLRLREVLNSQLEVTGESLYQLALTHRMLGDVEPATSAYKQAIDRMPHVADWRYEYAELLYSLQTDKSKQDALRQLDEALRLNPNLVRAANLRALIKSEMSSR